MIFYTPQQYLDLDSWTINYGNDYNFPSEYFYADNPTSFVLDHTSPSYSCSSDHCGPRLSASSGSRSRYCPDPSCCPPWWSRCGSCNPCYSPICRPQPGRSRSAPPSIGIWGPQSSNSGCCPPWSRCGPSNPCHWRSPSRSRQGSQDSSSSCRYFPPSPRCEPYNPCAPGCRWRSPSRSRQETQDSSSSCRYFPPSSRCEPYNPCAPGCRWRSPSRSRQGSQDSSSSCRYFPPSSRCEPYNPGCRWRSPSRSRQGSQDRSSCYPPWSTCGSCNPCYSPICRRRSSCQRPPSPSMCSWGSRCCCPPSSRRGSWSPPIMNRWGSQNPISSCCPPWSRRGSLNPCAPGSRWGSPSRSRQGSQDRSSCYPPWSTCGSCNPCYSPICRRRSSCRRSPSPSMWSWGSRCCCPPWSRCGPCNPCCLGSPSRSRSGSQDRSSCYPPWSTCGSCNPGYSRICRPRCGSLRCPPPSRGSWGSSCCYPPCCWCPPLVNEWDSSCLSCPLIYCDPCYNPIC